ncbi:hypothetical protein BDR26DRAFT_1006303 [Obelidium mucronatum]|nr:hypothetical protein BDR26DRAFT_1006303 [Obelidium mucronatum]
MSSPPVQRSASRPRTQPQRQNSSRSNPFEEEPTSGLSLGRYSDADQSRTGRPGYGAGSPPQHQQPSQPMQPQQQQYAPQAYFQPAPPPAAYAQQQQQYNPQINYGNQQQQQYYQPQPQPQQYMYNNQVQPQQQQQQQYYGYQPQHPQHYQPQQQAYGAKQPAYNNHQYDDVNRAGNSESTTPLQARRGYNDYEMDNLGKGATVQKEKTGIYKYIPSIPPQYQAMLERYLCCCCPKNKKHRMICCGAVVVVLIILGVIAYLFLPRYPEIKVYGIDLSNIGSSNSPYSFSYADPSKPDLNQMNFKMNLTMTLGTYNPNSYDFNVEQIDLIARMMVNRSVVFENRLTTPLTSFQELVNMIGLPPTTAGYYGKNDSIVGTSHYGNIVFPARKTVNYTMLFLLDYTPDPKLGLLKDPTILEIASVCGINSKSGVQRPMIIHYAATSIITSLKSLGFNPVLENDIKIKCPFSQDQITAVIRSVQNGKSIMDALSTVFGGGEGSVAPPPVIQIPDTPPTTGPVPTEAVGTTARVGTTESHSLSPTQTVGPSDSVPTDDSGIPTDVPEATTTTRTARRTTTAA